MFYKPKKLIWRVSLSLLSNNKLIARDCFNNEYYRIDLNRGESRDSDRVVTIIHNVNKTYKEQLLSAFEPKGKFSEGVKVRKKSGSWWEGKIVGSYSTSQTPEGYAVQLITENDNGPVQIYPAEALELIP